MSSYSQRTLIGQAVSSFGKGSGEPAMITKVDRFTATNLSYVVPAGVTYMIAHIRAGGGGIAIHTGSPAPGQGGNSSVAFAGGTITAGGGLGTRLIGQTTVNNAQAGPANSGLGAIANYADASTISGQAMSGAEIVAGGAVTPAATLAITVGAGGTAGNTGAAGGSGYVYLEYQVKA